MLRKGYEEVGSEQEGRKDKRKEDGPREVMELSQTERERILKARKRAEVLAKEGPKPRPEIGAPVSKEFPDSTSALLKRIFCQELQVSIGELASVSPQVQEGVKRFMTRKKVLPPPTIEAKAGFIREYPDSDDEDYGDSGVHFSCPLGFLDVVIKGDPIKALVDSGSMVNVISEEWVLGKRLPMVGREMKLRGIGGHITELVGMLENVVIKIRGFPIPCHFCVARGPVHTILGWPLLTDMGARLEYSEERGEIMSFEQGGNWVQMPLCTPQQGGWQRIEDMPIRRLGGFSGEVNVLESPSNFL